MDGILVVNKPQGWTSHDVVGHIRRLTHQKRVGHAGTLDPMATGVLLVCLGRATRVAEYLMDSDKTYRAVVRLGVETDTFDANGQVVATHPVNVDESDLRTALARFVGAIDQVPPMYSALKRDGKPLYRLARRGIEVERKPRRITIYDITLRAWQSPDATIDVCCSPGTYIRSLAHDIGAVLGCGAHLAALTRLASGSFRLEDAVTLEDLEGLGPTEGVRTFSSPRDLRGLLHPLDAALQDLPILTLDADQARRIVLGQAIPLSEVKTSASPLLCRAHDASGALLAIMAFDAAAQVWRPKKMLADATPT
jgi:tRNA pseudouridine55 synthase